jgi:hypothetical protein
VRNEKDKKWLVKERLLACIAVYRAAMIGNARLCVFLGSACSYSWLLREGKELRSEKKNALGRKVGKTVGSKGGKMLGKRR